MDASSVGGNPAGQYPMGAYPESTYPGGSYPNGVYPGDPSMGGQYPNQAFPDQAYANQGYTYQNYPNQGYPGQGYDNQGYYYQQPQNSPYTAYQQTYPQAPQAQPQYQQEMPYQPVNSYPYQVGGQPADQAKPQEKVKSPRREIDMERIVRPFVILGLPVMMIMFVICMVFGNILWMKWTFIGLALCVLGVMWMNKKYFQRDMILTFSVVLGALVLVGGVSALTSSGSQPRTVMVTPTPAPADPLAVGLGGDLMTTAPVTEAAAAWVEVTPAPVTAQDSGLNSIAVERMKSFLHFWSANDMDSMITLCLPSWAASYSAPKNALYEILANRVPVDYTATAISGTDNDVTRTVTTTITLNRNNTTSVAKYVFKVVMTKENENWYIDPRSLESNVRATATPASAEITQPPTPAPAADDSVILFYNPDGGTMYHIDPDCKSTHSKYKPFKGNFTYGQINVAPYSSLTPCSICGAPLRPGS